MKETSRRNKMERIARALFEHGTTQKAAAALGIAEVTVWRWKQKPEFREVYNAVRREALAGSSSRLLQGSSAAATTILKVMVDPNTSAAVRVHAAQRVLEHAEKTFELEDLAVRIERLEAESKRK